MIIGLTGGIATGKSTVSKYLQDKYHIKTYDADVYARNAMTPGQPAFDAICERYGTSVLNPDGQLNRVWLGERVFADTAERRWLERLIHPLVRQQYAGMYQQFANSDTPVVFSIPLLFEAEMMDLVQQVWVVWCTTGQQYQRLMARNTWTRTQSHARITAQLPLFLKMWWADELLDNSGTLTQLYQHIDGCIKRISMVL